MVLTFVPVILTQDRPRRLGREHEFDFHHDPHKPIGSFVLLLLLVLILSHFGSCFGLHEEHFLPTNSKAAGVSDSY